jgi:hypothetical protein
MIVGKITSRGTVLLASCNKPQYKINIPRADISRAGCFFRNSASSSFHPFDKAQDKPLSFIILSQQTCQVKPDRAVGFAVCELDDHFGVGRWHGKRQGLLPIRKCSCVAASEDLCPDGGAFVEE